MSIVLNPAGSDDELIQTLCNFAGLAPEFRRSMQRVLAMALFHDALTRFVTSLDASSVLALAGALPGDVREHIAAELRQLNKLASSLRPWLPLQNTVSAKFKKLNSAPHDQTAMGALMELQNSVVHHRFLAIVSQAAQRLGQPE